MGRLPAGQPLLAVPVDRGRLAARAGGTARLRDRVACPPPRSMNHAALAPPQRSFRSARRRVIERRLNRRRMTGTGSWSPDQPEGFRHIGVSDPSVAARCTAFGNQVDLIAPGDDVGSPRVVLTRPEALHGVRLEYFDAANAAQFLGYLRSRTVGS